MKTQAAGVGLLRWKFLLSSFFIHLRVIQVLFSFVIKPGGIKCPFYRKFWLEIPVKFSFNPTETLFVLS